MTLGGGRLGQSFLIVVGHPLPIRGLVAEKACDSLCTTLFPAALLANKTDRGLHHESCKTQTPVINYSCDWPRCCGAGLTGREGVGQGMSLKAGGSQRGIFLLNAGR